MRCCSAGFLKTFNGGKLRVTKFMILTTFKCKLSSNNTFTPCANIQKSFHLAQQKLSPLDKSTSPPLPYPLTTMLCFLPVHLATLVPYIKVTMFFSFCWLACCTEHNVLKVHPCPSRCQDCLPFCLLLHSMSRPLFLYPFISGLLGCFRNLAVANNAFISMIAHIFL